MADDGDYEDEPEATPEEKLAIAKYFVRQSPPGHVGVTLEALKKLNMSDILDEAQVKALLTEYHTKNKTVVDYEDGGVACKLLVTEEGKVGDEGFLNTSGKKVVAFDFVAGTAGAARDATEDELCPGEKKVDDVQKAVQALMDVYTAKSFAKTGCAGVYADGDKLVVVISAISMKLKAYWSGRWTSSYEIDLGDGECTIKGTITALCHYFEEGNVQMRSKKELPSEDISYEDKDDLAKQIASKIESYEANLHTEFDNMIQGMQEASFRALRRALPINKQMFNWKNPQAYKVANRFAQGQ